MISFSSRLRASRAIPSAQLPVSNSRIPLRIFQTWKSKLLPPDFARWSNTWRSHHPGSTWVLQDDAENRLYIKQRFGFFLPTYDRYPREIFRADAIRYFQLFDFGGLYADMDFECLRSLAPLFNAHCDAAVFGRVVADESWEHAVPNALMFSAQPQHLFWLFCIHRLWAACPSNGSVLEATGPVFLSRALRDYRQWGTARVMEQCRGIAAEIGARPASIAAGPTVTLEPNALYPLAWCDPAFRRLSAIARARANSCNAAAFPRSYAITYWTNTWRESP